MTNECSKLKQKLREYFDGASLTYNVQAIIFFFAVWYVIKATEVISMTFE